MLNNARDYHVKREDFKYALWEILLSRQRFDTYRVTNQVVSKVMFTSKQRLCFSICALH